MGVRQLARKRVGGGSPYRTDSHWGLIGVPWRVLGHLPLGCTPGLVQGGPSGV